MGTVQFLESYRLSHTAVFEPARLDRADLGLHVNSSFRIQPDDRVFVLGSCFAYELREVLSARGFDVHGGELGNKYNTFSTNQAVTWALDGGYGEHLLVQLRDGTWFDGHRHPFRRHDVLEKAVEKHQEVLTQTADAIRTCDIAIFTLGLVEVWRDDRLGVWLNLTPPRDLVPDFERRYCVCRTTHAQNLEALLATLRRVHAENPHARMLCTVSPVPLKATFFGDDVTVSNMYSKATLRSVATEAIERMAAESSARVDYFPSYELAALRPRDEVWRRAFPNGEPDARHVRAEFVRDVIIRLFLEHYLAQTDHRHSAERPPACAAATTRVSDASAAG